MKKSLSKLPLRWRMLLLPVIGSLLIAVEVGVIYGASQRLDAETDRLQRVILKQQNTIMAVSQDLTRNHTSSYEMLKNASGYTDEGALYDAGKALLNDIYRLEKLLKLVLTNGAGNGEEIQSRKLLTDLLVQYRRHRGTTILETAAFKDTANRAMTASTISFNQLNSQLLRHVTLLQTRMNRELRAIQTQAENQRSLFYLVVLLTLVLVVLFSNVVTGFLSADIRRFIEKLHDISGAPEHGSNDSGHEVALLSEAIMHTRQTWTELNDTRHSLDSSNQQLADALTDLNFQKSALDKHAIVSIADAKGRITYVNDLFCAISGYSPDELMGNDHRLLNSGVHPRQFFVDLWKTIGKGGTWQGEICNKTKSGSLYWVTATIVPFIGKNDRPFQYVAIRNEITAIKEAEARLAENVTELEDANRAKSDFVAVMSHEIRTPLNGVLGMAEVMRESGLSKEHMTHLDVIRNSGRHLLAIIDDILDFSRIDAGMLELNEEPFKPIDLVRDVEQVLAAGFREKGLTFSSKIDMPDNVACRGDVLRLRQVLLNLVGNALKFTDRGSVEVAVTRTAKADGKSTVLWQVRDTGIGIEQSAQEKLFDSFTQLEASMTRRQGGTGLGLAICKRIVEAMDGRIGVDSAPGEGSLFWYETVLEDCSIPATTEVDARQLQLTENDDVKNARVLIVEDNPVNQKVATLLVEKLGPIVDVASDGLQAVEITGRMHFDLILMDLQMPGMDGLEATRRIRQQGLCQDVPIIALTANVRDEDRHACTAAGMNDFVSKPVQVDKLQSILEQYNIRNKKADDVVS